MINLIGIDQLRPILNQLKNNEITYGKACRLVSDAVLKEQWQNVEKDPPLAFAAGDWDGLKSDIVIIRGSKREYSLAVLYKQKDGTIDWYDQNDNTLDFDPIYWKKLDYND